MTKKIVTVSYGRVRGRARNYQYWEPAIYQLGFRKNGKAVWLLDHLTNYRARRSYTLAEQDAKQYAQDNSLEYLSEVRQYQDATPYDTQVRPDVVGVAKGACI